VSRIFNQLPVDRVLSLRSHRFYLTRDPSISLRYVNNSCAPGDWLPGVGFSETKLHESPELETLYLACSRLCSLNTRSRSRSSTASRLVWTTRNRKYRRPLSGQRSAGTGRAKIRSGVGTAIWEIRSLCRVAARHPENASLGQFFAMPSTPSNPAPASVE